MSKFGRFIAGANHPLETFEGDYMVHRDDYVEIKKKRGLTEGDDYLVAVINMVQGESVRELGREEAARAAQSGR